MTLLLNAANFNFTFTRAIEQQPDAIIMENVFFYILEIN